jgi:hypothetical protein
MSLIDILYQIPISISKLTRSYLVILPDPTGGFDEPIELYPGKVFKGASVFDGKKAIIIDYSDHAHEFNAFRDELREIYPGVYLGKMYALPGTKVRRISINHIPYRYKGSRYRYPISP